MPSDQKQLEVQIRFLNQSIQSLTKEIKHLSLAVQENTQTMQMPYLEEEVEQDDNPMPTLSNPGRTQ